MCPPEKCCCFELELGLKIFGGLQIAMLSFYIVMSEPLPIPYYLRGGWEVARHDAPQADDCSLRPGLMYACRAQ